MITVGAGGEVPGDARDARKEEPSDVKRGVKEDGTLRTTSAEHRVFMRLRPTGEFLLTPPLSESCMESISPPSFCPCHFFLSINPRVPMHCIELDS